jgi:hypothetical protein
MTRAENSSVFHHRQVTSMEIFGFPEAVRIDLSELACVAAVRGGASEIA